MPAAFRAPAAELALPPILQIGTPDSACLSYRFALPGETRWRYITFFTTPHCTPRTTIFLTVPDEGAAMADSRQVQEYLMLIIDRRG